MDWFTLSDFDSVTIYGTIATALLAGLARGFSGFGAALIFVPLAGSLIGPKTAAPILVLIDAVFSMPLIPAAWKLADKKSVGVMFLGSMIGIPLGTAILSFYSTIVLRWLICALAAAMLLLLLSGWRYRGRPHVFLTIAVGWLSGLFTGIAQIGGPPVVGYFTGIGASPSVMRASIIIFFALSTCWTLISYGLNGLISTSVFSLALLSGPAYGLGVGLGAWLFPLADARTFRYTTLALIALAIITSLPIYPTFR